VNEENMADDRLVADGSAARAAPRAGDELGGAFTGHLPPSFLSAPARIGTAFPPGHPDRPREVKDRYDPLNVLGGDRALTARPLDAPGKGEPR
jgi:hypothetical protein